MQTSALFGAKNSDLFKFMLWGVSIFRDFMRTSFMDSPIILCCMKSRLIIKFNWIIYVEK